MTNLDATAVHDAGTSCERQAARTLGTILGRLVRAYRARRQARHLEGLSDHLLTDIGISRDEIRGAVRWGERAG